MAYNFSDFKKRIEEIKEWLRKELSTIRTGRATPAILDGVKVESYGSLMPINQLANITVEDPKTIRISPWDASQLKAIEKAIMLKDIGLSVSTDGKGLRVAFPEVTQERRLLLIKASKEKLEEARVSLRQERDKVWNEIQAMEKSGKVSEDEKFRLKDQMQKIIEEGSASLEESAQRKEKEITEG
jgi:ribosome recycling factor